MDRCVTDLGETAIANGHGGVENTQTRRWRLTQGAAFQRDGGAAFYVEQGRGLLGTARAGKDNVAQNNRVAFDNIGDDPTVGGADHGAARHPFNDQIAGKYQIAGQDIARGQAQDLPCSCSQIKRSLQHRALIQSRIGRQAQRRWLKHTLRMGRNRGAGSKNNGSGKDLAAIGERCLIHGAILPCRGPARHGHWKTELRVVPCRPGRL